jgi:hypothetical protein
MWQFHWTTVVSDLTSLKSCRQFAGAAMVRSRGGGAVGVRGRSNWEHVSPNVPGQHADMYAGRLYKAYTSKCSRRRFEDGVGFARNAEGVEVRESRLAKASTRCRADGWGLTGTDGHCRRKLEQRRCRLACCYYAALERRTWVRLILALSRRPREKKLTFKSYYDQS